MSSSKDSNGSDDTSSSSADGDSGAGDADADAAAKAAAVAAARPPVPLSQRIRRLLRAVRAETVYATEYISERLRPTPPVTAATGKHLPYIPRRRLLHPGARPTFFEHEMPELYWDWERSFGFLDDVNALAARLTAVQTERDAREWQELRAPLPQGLAIEQVCWQATHH